MTKGQEIYLKTPAPVSLIQTIDRIRELRALANEPYGNAAEARARAFTAEAIELETNMESCIGWCYGW